MAMAVALLFGKAVISSRIVFLQTKLSYAFTNRKPVVPGHVLVASKRVVARFHELTLEEVSDLFSCVHRLSPILQQHYNATSLTIAIQDGKDAGQTIEHVHVHILPRRGGDFERNDDVYDKLEHHDVAERNFRSEAEMSEEADKLRKSLDHNR